MSNLISIYKQKNENMRELFFLFLEDLALRLGFSLKITKENISLVFMHLRKVIKIRIVTRDLYVDKMKNVRQLIKEYNYLRDAVIENSKTIMSAKVTLHPTTFVIEKPDLGERLEDHIVVNSTENIRRVINIGDKIKIANLGILIHKGRIHGSEHYVYWQFI